MEESSTQQNPIQQASQQSNPTNILHNSRVFLFIVLGIIIILIGYIILIGFPENKKCGEVLACHGVPWNNQCLGYKTTFAFIDCAKTNPKNSILSILPTPTIDETANWKIYTDSTYSYFIKYPNDWILVQGKDFDGYPNIKITNNSQKNVNGSTELYISIGGPYSTSGAVCANSICKEAKKVNVNIENKNYVFPILQSAVFYTFTFEIDNKEINTPIINNLPSYSTYLSATSTYKSLEEERIILDILSTFKFTQ